MDAALSLLKRCRDAGLTVEPDDGQGLNVRKPKRAEPLVEELRRHKAEVRRLLVSVRVELVEDAGRRAYRLVRLSDGEPLHLGLCVSERWARALAAEHGLVVREASTA